MYPEGNRGNRKLTLVIAPGQAVHPEISHSELAFRNIPDSITVQT